MQRRDLLKAAVMFPAALAAKGRRPRPPLARLRISGRGPAVRDRLNQGPFDIDQDQGWRTVLFTTPSERPLRNPGLGLVGYAWEESGPSLAAEPAGKHSTARRQNLQSCPLSMCSTSAATGGMFSRARDASISIRFGNLTLDAAKRKGLRVAFRIQLSNTSFQPEQVALARVPAPTMPLVKIGRIPGQGGGEYREPRYDHPGISESFFRTQRLAGRAL